MDLARVIGTVVATEKDPLLVGQKLSILQPLDERLAPVGAPLVATDFGARRGTGEVVFFVRSGDAMPTGPDGTLIPVDAAVVGIVDEVSLDERYAGRRGGPGGGSAGREG